VVRAVIQAGQFGLWAATRPFRTTRSRHTRTNIITTIIIPHRTAGIIIRTEVLTPAVDTTVADLMAAEAAADITKALPRRNRRLANSFSQRSLES